MGVAGFFRFMLETMTCKTDMNFETTLISWCVCVCAPIQTWHIIKFALFPGHQTNMIYIPLHHAVRCLTQHAHSLLSMSVFTPFRMGVFLWWQLHQSMPCSGSFGAFMILFVPPMEPSECCRHWTFNLTMWEVVPIATWQ